MADKEQYQAQAADQAELRWIPIDHIDPAEDNPREELTGIDELAASIREVGLLEPVLVAHLADRDRNSKLIVDLQYNQKTRGAEALRPHIRTVRRT
jgi:hypothetical protein